MQRSYDIESRISRLEERMDSRDDDFAELKRDVHTIRDVVVGSKGGMRALAILFGAATAIGGFIASWSAWIAHKP